MIGLLALLLLAAAGSAGLASLWELVGIAVVGGGVWLRERQRGLDTPDSGSAHDVVIATIYERQGRLVLRRRRAA